MTLATETIKLWRNNAGITAGETAEDDPEHIAAKAILALTAELLANREAQPVGFYTTVSGRKGVIWHNGAPEDDTAIYTVPIAGREAQPVAGELGEIRVGRLPTMNQEEYPGLGDWWVQMRIGASGDEILARVYGATPDEAVARALALTAPPAPAVPDGLKRAVTFYEQVKRENTPVETGVWKDAVNWVLEEACRAAMLNHVGDANEKAQQQIEPQNIPNNIPGNLAAAVNRLLDCDGTRGHFSAIRCSDAREEVEHLLAQPVSSGYTFNSPVIPDGWIACSERVPDADGAYWCWFGKEDPSVIQQRVCIWINRHHEWCDSAVTHWMPLPAAPEVSRDDA
ncbi:DUF551 domain-containing protein [Serratia sp. IR-2025]